MTSKEGKSRKEDKEEQVGSSVDMLSDTSKRLHDDVIVNASPCKSEVLSESSLEKILDEFEDKQYREIDDYWSKEEGKLIISVKWLEREWNQLKQQILQKIEELEKENKKLKYYNGVFKRDSDMFFDKVKKLNKENSQLKSQLTQERQKTIEEIFKKFAGEVRFYMTNCLKRKV